MKSIALDPSSLVDVALEDAFLDRDISIIREATPGMALKACITDPEIRVFMFFLAEANFEQYNEIASRIKEINPLLEVICICASDAVFSAVQDDAAEQGVFLISLGSGTTEVAEAVLRHGQESRHGRRAHRIDCNLRAVLYRHDEMDQKIPDGSHLVEVISLSANGAYVAVGRCEVSEGETYLFEINLPDLIYLVKGQVVWLNLEGTQRDRPKGFALSFLEMSDAPQDFLEKRIHEDMIDSILKKRGIL